MGYEPLEHWGRLRDARMGVGAGAPDHRDRRLMSRSRPLRTVASWPSSPGRRRPVSGRCHSTPPARPCDRRGPARVQIDAAGRRLDLSRDGRWLVSVVDASRASATMELWLRSMETGQETEAQHRRERPISRRACRVTGRLSPTGVSGKTLETRTGCSGCPGCPGPAAPSTRSPETLRKPGPLVGGRHVDPAQRPVHESAAVDLHVTARRHHTPRGMRTIMADPDHAIYQGRFSPDGRWVIFNAQSRQGIGTSVIGVVPATGGKWTALTDASLWADKPRWAPDGRTIYFFLEPQWRLFQRLGASVRSQIPAGRPARSSR